MIAVKIVQKYKKWRTLRGQNSHKSQGNTYLVMQTFDMIYRPVRETLVMKLTHDSIPVISITFESYK